MYPPAETVATILLQSAATSRPIVAEYRLTPGWSVLSDAVSGYLDNQGQCRGKELRSSTKGGCMVRFCSKCRDEIPRKGRCLCRLVLCRRCVRLLLSDIARTQRKAARPTRAAWGYNTWHLLALSKRPGFMPCLNETALIRELRSARFSTPLLRPRVSWLASRLAHDNRLLLLDGFQTQTALLNVGTPELDELVSCGLRDGYLSIPTQEVA
jgi:hypothetical protein